MCRNSTPYELQTSDALKVTIKHSSSRTVVPHAVEPAPPTNHSKLRLSFSTRLAGGYSMDVTINGKKIADSPFSRNYLPGRQTKTFLQNEYKFFDISALLGYLCIC